MTVLEKKAASDTDTKSREVPGETEAGKKRKFRTYLAVGVVAATVGVGAVAAANRLGLLGTEQLNPAQIAEISAAQFAEHLENQYRAQLAQIHEQRAQDMVEFYSRQYQARLLQIHEQRAQDMVEFYFRQYQARLNRVNEQRAQDMVTFQRGWQGEGS